MNHFRCIQIIAFALLPNLLWAGQLDDLKELVKSEQYDKAYSLASSMSEANAGDSGFDYLYGFAARKAGHPEVAIFALERVTMQNPRDAAAAYERGLALLELNDLLSAKFEFESVLTLESSDQMKQNAKKLLELTKSTLYKQANPTQFHMEVSADVGYNSNVNSSALEADVALGQAPAVKDGFANLGITALIKRKINKSDAFFFSAASNNRKNFRSPNWDYNTLSARTGVEIGFGNFQLRLPVEFELLLNNYQVVRAMPSLGALLLSEWNDNNLSTFSVIARHKGYIDSTNNHMSLLLSFQHDARQLWSGVDAHAELFYAPGFAYAAVQGPVVKSEAGINGVVSVEFLKSHFLSPSFGFRYLHYPISAQPSTARDDFNILGQLSYEWHPNDSWSLGPTFLYVYNHSTDAMQSYMRYQVQLGVRYLL